MTAVAVIRVIIGLGLYLSGQTTLDRTPVPIEAYAVLAATFGILGLTLVATNRHDVRASWLGGVFVLVSAPLCSPFLRGSEELRWLLLIRPDAWLPAFLWCFVGAFPTPWTGRAGRAARAVARIAAIVAAGLALVNLSLLIGDGSAGAQGWRRVLQPTAASGSLYYPIVFGSSAASFAALFARARAAAPEDRRRLKLFAGGLVAGLAPFALQATLEVIPAYNAFVHQHRPTELAVGLFLFTALAAVPFITAYSVLFDRVVDLRVALRTAAQYGLARYTIIGAALVPLAALALFVLHHRAEPIAALLTGPRPSVLGAIAALGFVALRVRQPLLDRLDRRFFREEYDARQSLDWLMNELRRVSDAADLEARLDASVDRALHARACLFVAGEPKELLQRPGEEKAPISVNALLVQLAGADAAPMDVDPGDDRSPFRRLPPDEQRWLLVWRVCLLVALRAADGRPIGLLALSSKQSGLPYSDDDRRFLSAVGASVSMALDNLRLRSNPDLALEPAAVECARCARLHPAGTTVCSCGGAALAAVSAPHVLRGVFRLDRRIGVGGMGVVYQARDLNLDRAVAIKTLPRVSPSDAARLRVEARAMAAVAHPNLAVIHGVETWNGVPFLIEEFLAGGSLADRLARGPLQIGEALHLCITLADALEHLHQAGIVHRDVKPSNIGFTVTGIVKLLDFGLARLTPLAAAPTDTTRHPADRDASADALLSARRLVGTPAYMAPEARMGRSPRPSFDLWSLSVVLYESLTGRRPFDASGDLKWDRSGRVDPFTPPSAIQPECGAAIDAFFATAFAADAALRPADAAAFRGALIELRKRS